MITAMVIGLIVDFSTAGVAEEVDALQSMDSSSDAIDEHLESTHWRMLALGIGRMVEVILMWGGGIIILVGSYQAARMVEKLQQQMHDKSQQGL
ncbi:MAG: hypothetical protein ACI9R3_005493 [Verrucomicrobiales bacterium]|jgi:hypothetical protein